MPSGTTRSRVSLGTEETNLTISLRERTLLLSLLILGELLKPGNGPQSGEAWDKTGNKITAYPPLGSRPLPDGGGPIGISASYETGVGKKVAYKPGKTEGGGLINKLLRPFGYRAAAVITSSRCR